MMVIVVMVVIDMEARIVVIIVYVVDEVAIHVFVNFNDDGD